MNALTRSKRAFLEASAAAAVIMAAVLEHRDVVKSESGLDPAQMAAALVEKIATTTIEPLQKSGILTDCVCKHCQWEREDSLAYERMEKRAALVDKTVAVEDNRPHLDEERAMEPEVPATPWRSPKRAEQHEAQENPPAVIKLAAEMGFEDQGEDVLIHRGLGHEITVSDDGTWLIKSGWNGDVYKGTTPDDLVEAMELMDQ